MRNPFRKESEPRQVLVVMHTDDMVRVHPQTDWTHNCSKCLGRVGIYPSGQKIIKRFPGITLVCNRCQPDNTLVELAPGTLEEAYHSRWRNKEDPN